MRSEEFVARFLPENWAERDLQLLIQKRLKRFGILLAPDEVRIQTPTTTRRIDIATWRSNYEVKKYLTRDNIFHAVGQSVLYGHYGPKLLWIFPKRKTIIGLAPPDAMEYQNAIKVAQDFQAMGIDVIFVNERAEWFPVRSYGNRLIIGLGLGFGLAFAVVAGIGSYYVASSHSAPSIANQQIHR